MIAERMMSSARSHPLMAPFRRSRLARSFLRFARDKMMSVAYEHMRRESIERVRALAKQPYSEVLLQEAERIPSGYNEDNENFAILEINNTCNIDCLMCKTSLATRQKGVIKSEVMEIALDRLSEIGIDHVSLHTIGDPLANPRLEEAFRLLRKHGFRANISTNGLLVSKHVDTLLKYKDVCAHLRFSIDGASKATYEKIRAGGSWSELNRNLDVFMKQLSPKGFSISINMTMSKDNVHEVGKYIETFCSYVESPADDLHVGFVNSLSPDTTYFEEVNLFPKHTFLNSPCPLVIQAKPYVLIDGNISTCCRDYDGSMILGDIKEDDLGTIYQGEKLSRLRRAHLENRTGDYPLCESCYVKSAS